MGSPDHGDVADVPYYAALTNVRERGKLEWG